MQSMGLLMTEEKENKSGYKSEFSMGALDFERMDQILKAIDQHGFLIRLNNSANAVKPYYSSLKQLYFNIRPLMSEENKNNYDATFKIMNTKIYDKKGFLRSIVDDLELLNQNLMDQRQKLGLGIVANRTKDYGAMRQKEKLSVQR